MEGGLIYKELSYVINGCIFDVHNEVGPGLREECYQKAMEHRLAQEGIACIGKPSTRREFVHRGRVVAVFEPDLVVAQQIILELKAQREGLAGENFAQLLSYLKSWGSRLGLLVNFGQSQAVIERLPNLPRDVIAEEDYEFIKHLLTPEIRPLLRVVRNSLLDIHLHFGCGYIDATYRKLLEVELQHHRLTCQPAAVVRPCFHDRILPVSPISPLLVQDAILVEIQAVHDEISATSIRIMQTHLRLTGCAIGLIASFGKRRFAIRGVHA